MHISRSRHALVALVAVALAMPAAAGTPAAAQAASPTCQQLLDSTPPVTVDLDGDGNPEVRLPRIEDVTLCGGSSPSYVAYPPTIERCFIGWHPTCVAVRVNVLPAKVSAATSVELCATVDGIRTCRKVDTARLTEVLRPMVVCIGVDLSGGSPCSHGGVVGLE